MPDREILTHRCPPGARAAQVFVMDGQLIVLGIPTGEDEESHNCDAMGCGSTTHVVARIPVPADCEVATWPEDWGAPRHPVRAEQRCMVSGVIDAGGAK